MTSLLPVAPPPLAAFGPGSAPDTGASPEGARRAPKKEAGPSSPSEKAPAKPDVSIQPVISESPAVAAEVSDLLPEEADAVSSETAFSGKMEAPDDKAAVAEIGGSGKGVEGQPEGALATGAGGVPGGQPGGVPGGSIDGDGYLSASQVARPPRWIGNLIGPGDYPRLARRQGKDGRVLLSVFIDEAGRVRDVRLLQGSYEVLNEVALRKVREAMFTPAQSREGRAVPCKVTLPIRFQLQ